MRTETERITCPERLGVDQLDDLFRALRPICEAGRPSVCAEIDLRGVTFCEPSGLVVLNSAMHAAQAAGIFASGSRLLLPTDAGVRRYVRRMDALEGIVTFVGDEDFQRNRPAGFAPVVKIEDLESGIAAARDLIAAVQGNRTTLLQLHAALGEMIDNISYHSGDEVFGSACCQTWSALRSIQFAIADRGRGIPTALTSHPAYADLTAAEAFERSIHEGVTSNPERCAGLGLFSVSEMISANGGRMVVHSGPHRMVQNGEEKRFVATAQDWPGTLIVLSFQLDEPISIYGKYPGGLEGPDEIEF
jgi:hypothetical protein